MTIVPEAVTIPVSDGTTMRAHLSRPVGGAAPIAVLVAHELFAVNPDIRGVADELARAGYLALAPEFYHRHAEAGRWLERTDAGRREGFALLHRVHREEALADVDACLTGWVRSPGFGGPR